MQRSSGSRLFPLFLVGIVIIIIIIAIISIGRAFFGSDSSSDIPVDRGRTELLKTSTLHSVRMMVRGPIVADENFASYTIDVSPTSRDVTVYEGYLDTVSDEKSLSNNDKAYEQFVYALDNANIMKGDESTDDSKNDLRGICATGYIYEYSVRAEHKTIKHLWTSTCKGSKGTLEASSSQLNSLFSAQVPSATKLLPFQSSSTTTLRF